MNPKHLLASAVIVLCVGMQASVALTGTKVWPFMAYCMYAIPQDAPPRYRLREVMVRWDDGTIEPVRASMLGVGWYSWERHYMRPMISGDRQITLESVEKIDAIDDRRLVEISVDFTTHTVTDEGVVQQHESRRLWPFMADDADTDTDTDAAPVDAVTEACCQ